MTQSHQLSTLISLSRLHIIHTTLGTVLQEGTSLKLSNAERMISWPPRTRHTAARSSRTNAFVLHQKKNQKNNDNHEYSAPLRGKKKGQSKIHTMNRLPLQVIYQTEPYPPNLSNICPSGEKSSALYPLFENFQNHELKRWAPTPVCRSGFVIWLMFNTQTRFFWWEYLDVW